MYTITLFEFQSPILPWSNIDDVVMGGASSSRMRIEDGVAIFEGALSLENKGGFASVRSGVIQKCLDGYIGIRLRVKGDGKKYQFRIRTDENSGDYRYWIEFETRKGRWIEVDLPFSKFVAAFRGKEVPNYPPIETSRIATLGFFIGDKQEGSFLVEVDWVKAYRNGSRPI